MHDSKHKSDTDDGKVLTIEFGSNPCCSFCSFDLCKLTDIFHFDWVLCWLCLCAKWVCFQISGYYHVSCMVVWSTVTLTVGNFLSIPRVPTLA